ncbi:MAG: tetratricopeptide repeat protein [Candidatus Eiseniibacteriota bacterium]
MNDTTARVRVELLRELANDAPDDSTTWFLLGRELLRLGMAGEAVDAFEHVVAVEPDYTAAYRQLGNALEQENRFEDAARVYRRGVEVSERTQDLQAGKEMRAFLKRLARDHGVASSEPDALP